MNKILRIQQATEIARKLKEQGKTVVIVGGFFDILHLGHIRFLEKAKKYGDYLFILLEEDGKAAKIKSENRPINSQKDRAEVLSALQSVDYVIPLKNMTNNRLYDKIMVQIRPDIIATTYGDPYVAHKKRQARLTGAKVVYVIKRMKNYSTTKYVGLL